MKHCPSCGSELRSEAKFCPKCGHKLDVEKDLILPDDKEDHRQPRRPFVKIVLGLVVVLALTYFLYNLTASDNTAPYVDQILQEVSGTYIDPSGSIEGVINVSSLNGRLIGRTSSGNFDFDISPTGKYHFEGKVTLEGVDSEYKASYDQSRGTLTFSWDLSPSSWYIEKKE